MIITLSYPPKILSPNALPHWGTLAAAKKNYRAEALTAAYVAKMHSEAEGPWPWPAATVKAVFYCKSNRNRDGDNALASLKAAIDGIASAGIVANDSRFIHLPAEFQIDKARPRVEIFLTKVR